MILKRNKEKVQKFSGNSTIRSHTIVFFALPDGLAHCRSTSAIKLFEMMKRLFNYIFPMQVTWILLNFHSGNFRLSRNAKNRKFRENIVMAGAECMANCLVRAFVIGSLTFYSSMILSAQVHGIHNFIGLCCTL